VLPEKGDGLRLGHSLREKSREWTGWLRRYTFGRQRLGEIVLAGPQGRLSQSGGYGETNESSKQRKGECDEYQYRSFLI